VVGVQALAMGLALVLSRAGGNVERSSKERMAIWLMCGMYLDMSRA
jgi:hypothetical protein